ncbi:MAG: hypothetical protein P1P87_07480 [Trueperaceae bacterium]|nr:hypothetical protein [Trueperaceae bacterium]
MLHEPSPANEPVRTMTDEDLNRIIVRCESAIADGTAQVSDYEAFVLAQKELARRTWAA